MRKNLIVILGATASGKTKLAVRLAAELGGEIISADSRQVYRGMNIGTGKDIDEYIVDGRKIKYHMIDVIEPEEEFSLFDYQRDFYEIFMKLTQENTLPVMVGGTGLYLEAVLAAYDLPFAPKNEKLRKELGEKTEEELRALLLSLKPLVHNKTDLEDRARLIRAIEIEMTRNKTGFSGKKPYIDAAVFGIRWERDMLRKRITRRLEERLAGGMVEEVAQLHEKGVAWSRLENFGLEYKFIAMYLQEKIGFQEMKNKLNTAIHQFAKRQETWFRRMERKGIVINWIDGDDYHMLKEGALKQLS
ncbi:MAG TPA: tRNA (adenosine(37)-N6)-dimethylallyltransferase MiaA [Smithellaceae bacterium]|mgnify:CR=1 FL=1|nr:tRNA (adenosine(37)-N6)-dimethylallyltransferase MiaA [Smithellaceae bacterium]HRS89192.1 tRNA (adenosine(37)-N6)-dimethylallyltransferase MiaA [Smithellaceae bacterium]HRV26116.1 tRNA (adenosine(37)-N6)-dimethylallyltransferase MiaA [Smithellaceae bacterium]